jgi:hypothetical protein
MSRTAAWRSNIAAEVNDQSRGRGGQLPDGADARRVRRRIEDILEASRLERDFDADEWRFRGVAD